MMKRFLMIALFVGLVGLDAKADIIFQDGFNYPDGNLTANVPWVAHSGAGNAPVQVSAGRVSIAHGALSREDVSVQFGQVSAGVISYAFDVIVNSAPFGSGTDFEYFAHFGQQGPTSPSLTNNFLGRLDVVSSAAGDYGFGISSNNSVAEAVTSAGFTFGNTVSILVDYDLDAGLASLTVGGETIVSTTVVNTLPISAFALRQSESSNNEAILIDNLVISTPATPVPEPSTLAFAAIGGLGAFAQFRRRRKAAAKAEVAA